MSFPIYINQEPVELLQGSYQLSYEDFETVNKTESGRELRELIREGIPSIAISTYVNAAEAAQWRAWKALPSISVNFYDPGTGLYTLYEAWITSFKCTPKVLDVEEGRTGEVQWMLSCTIKAY